MIPKIIRCKWHGIQPWTMVCQHLIVNPLQEWKPVECEDGREVENDWLCLNCMTKYCKGIKTDDLLTIICMGCRDELRGELNV